ncbi:MAG: hypothetical protein HND57_06150 [Planctomycetes bacterium]|nr:hypothetical protein [Planctomycetota bacterium]
MRLTTKLITLTRALALSISTTAIAADPPRFEMLDLCDISGTLSGVPYHINNDGTVTGIADFDGTGDFQGVVWVGGTQAIQLSTLPGEHASVGAATSEAGLPVGTSYIIEEKYGRWYFYPTAVLWDGLVPVSLQDLVTSGPPDLELDEALAVNNHGVIIGAARDTVLERGRAFRLDVNTGELIDLGTLGGNSARPDAMNDNGIIVGQAWTAGGQNHAFRWENGSMTDLGTFGGRDSRATDVSESGRIVGGAQSTTSPELAVLWDVDGSMINLGTLGGNQSNANGISDDGAIVGFSTDSINYAHAFFYEDGTMWNLIDLIPPNQGWAGRANALGINDAQQVTGTMYRQDLGDRPFVATRVHLTIEPPVPGQAGTVNTINLTGATPGSSVYLVHGRNAALTAIPGCVGAPIHIADPQLAGKAQADEKGNAVVQGYVSNKASGKTLRLQAFERSICKVSNVVIHEF